VTFIKTDIKYWIGADESNHGVVPEIYVAVLSTNPNDVKRSPEIIGKQRKKVGIETILSSEQDFRFMVLENEHFRRIGRLSIKVPTIAQLIEGFSSQIEITKTSIIIDGKDQQFPLLEELIPIVGDMFHTELSSRRFRQEKDGDRHYPLVNIADRMAYQLKLIYENLRSGQKGPFDEKRVYLRL
jgi:hypothetical protein